MYYGTFFERAGTNSYPGVSAFNLVTKTFFFFNGKNVTNQNGTIGGTPVVMPGARNRFAYFSFPDKYPDLLFVIGGNGYSANSGTGGLMNDVWQYSMSANRWMYLRGSNSTEVNAPVYSGTGQTPSGFSDVVSGVVPGTDTVIIHTGWIVAGRSTNMLWLYQRSTNEWLFLGGNRTQFDEAASNNGAMLIGSSNGPLHAVGNPLNNTITIAMHQGWTNSKVYVSTCNLIKRRQGV
jgi:hypothetical protein